MLTGDLVRPRLRSRKGQLQVMMLPVENRYWQQTAAHLIGIFRKHIGRTQADWMSAVEAYEGERTDYIVVRGLAKVLSDSAVFEPVEMPLSPLELRQRLFTYGPVFAQGDLFQPRTRQDVLEATAEEMGIATDDLERLLYADRIGAYILTYPGVDWMPADLIARYNLELARAALYWSDGMRITIYDTYKDFWRYLKLFKLMFEAAPYENGYRVELDGPISPFVHATTRYGRQFAAFLPALFLGSRWEMQASVHPPGFKTPLTYTLNHTSSLRSHFHKSGAFDSQMEADFAAEFQAKFGDERGKWMLTREDEVLLLGDTVMIPDFALTHKVDGRRVLIEIVGFWHPEYLRRKLEKVRASGRRDLLLLVYEGVNLASERLRDLPSEVLYFKKKPVLKEVLEAVERIALIDG
jgi:uncharacterized protein